MFYFSKIMLSMTTTLSFIRCSSPPSIEKVELLDSMQRSSSHPWRWRGNRNKL